MTLLVGDIGGTNARFAILEDGRIGESQVLKNDAFPSLAAALSAYLAEHVLTRPERACLAIAGPIIGDRVKLTNRGWDFSIEAMRQETGLDELIILNDFEALALACPVLPEDGLVAIGPKGHAVPGAPVAVLGPGTGMGVAGAIQGRGRWIAVPGEGGHVELGTSDPRLRPALEVAYRRRDRVSTEHWLCGPGLLRMAADLAEAEARTPPGWTSPAELVRDASAGDGFARDVIALFLGQFASFAGDVALTLGARGGIYLGGGVLDHLLPFFDPAQFHARLMAKGRLSGFLDGVPVWRITADTPALHGCAAKLLNG